MNIIGREAYIRVTVTHIQNGMAYCIPVNNAHEAFDGAGFMPGKLVVHLDAVATSPLNIPVEPCPLIYNGKQINKKRVVINGG